MHAIWIEIPVADLARAKRFYEAVFAHAPTEVTDDGVRAITVIDGQPTVSLNRTEGFTPSAAGSLPYFHLDGPLDAALDVVTEHGGGIVEPAAARGDLGLFALVTDSEGNALYLHAAS